MAYAKEQYSKLSPDKLKMKKGLSLAFTIKDYQSTIKKEEHLLSEMFEKGAAMHYQAAIKLEGNKHWSNQINIAKKLEKVVYYAPNYKDAKERYTIARKEGICRMTLGRIHNTSQRGHLTEEAIRNSMILDLTQRGSEVNGYRYFKLIDTRQTNQVAANVELTVEVTNIYLKNGSIFLNYCQLSLVIVVGE